MVFVVDVNQLFCCSNLFGNDLWMTGVSIATLGRLIVFIDILEIFRWRPLGHCSVDYVSPETTRVLEPMACIG